MKLALKIFGGILLLLVVVIAGGFIYLKTAFPKVSEAPDINIEVTDERIERGKHLANNVFVCMDCHSDRDYSRFGLTIDEATIGKGGNLFGMEMGFPGNYYAKNLTPYHLGDWTDGEIFRAITSGVNKDGKSMFPIMPYPNYGKADKEDIYDIIAYLRSLEPVEHDVPESSSAFPMSLIINVMPMDPEFTTKPAPSDKLAYGKYLVTVASCGDCHTPMDDKGQRIPGMEFAGGMEFGVQSGGITTSANITPHPETGIGSWTEELFISRFKQYEDSTLYVNQTIVEPGQPNTEMPWRFYSKMSEEDLGAIFAYLQTVEPVDNKIETFRSE